MAGKVFGKAPRILGFSWEFLGQSLLSTVSCKTCSLLYDLKDLFTLRNLADRVYFVLNWKTDDVTSSKSDVIQGQMGQGEVALPMNLSLTSLILNREIGQNIICQQISFLVHHSAHSHTEYK